MDSHVTPRELEMRAHHVAAAAKQPSWLPCCKVAGNLTTVEVAIDRFQIRCVVCDRTHFRMAVDPGHYPVRRSVAP